MNERPQREELWAISIVMVLCLLIFMFSAGCRSSVDNGVDLITAPVKQSGTFEPDAALIIQSKCIGCHLAANPAKGVVLEYNDAPATPAELLVWSVDIKNRWAGVTTLTQHERDVLLQYGTEIPDPTPPETVFFTTVGGEVTWPAFIIEDGLRPGSNFDGWYQEGDFVCVVNDRKWFREYDGIWFQPNAYWFFNAQDQRQHNFDIQGVVYHASATGVVFGVSELLPGDRKARTYFELRIDDDEWFVRRREGADEKEVYFRGPYPNNQWLNKSEPVSYSITTQRNGDGTTHLTVELVYRGAVVGSFDGDIPRDVVGKVGAADYAWGSTVAKVSITYTADVVEQNTGVPE